MFKHMISIFKPDIHRAHLVLLRHFISKTQLCSIRHEPLPQSKPDTIITLNGINLISPFSRVVFKLGN